MRVFILLTTAALFLTGCIKKSSSESLEECQSIVCPSETRVKGKAPPACWEKSNFSERKNMHGVKCDESPESFGKSQCKLKMAQEGFKQWCETREETMHGPFIGWDKTGLRRMTGGYSLGQMDGLFVEWDHFGDISDLTYFKNGKRQGASYSIRDNGIYRCVWKDDALINDNCVFWSLSEWNNGME